MEISRATGKDRTRPCTAVYRSVMAVLEARRVELGLSMERVNDLAGLQDGYYSRALHADTTYGRQATWQTIDLIFQALFGSQYEIQVAAKNYRAPSKVETRARPSGNPTPVGMHWRHRKVFSDLGRRGAKALNNLPRERRSEIAKKAAATRLAKRRATALVQADEISHGGHVPCVAQDPNTQHRGTRDILSGEMQ